MTVETESLRDDYTATAAQTEFPFTVRIFADTDLQVYVDGVLKTLTTDYTVSIESDPNLGGTVTMTSGMVGGEAVAIVRAVPEKQTADYTAFGKFPAETHERRLDVLTVLAQQLREALNRAMKYGISSTNTDLEIPDPLAGYFWRWKSDLSGLENVSINDVTGIAVTPFAETLLDDSDADTFWATLMGTLTKADARALLGVLAASVFAEGASTFLRRNAGNTAWEALTAAQASDELIVARDWRGKNAIINGNFDVWQRGTSVSGSSGGFLADRWRTNASGITLGVSRQTFALGQTDVPGNPKYFHRVSTDSLSAGASQYAQLDQWIEGVQTYSGQTVTLSFYAKADAAKDVAIGFVQEFGTGGSPSSAVYVTPQTVSLTTSWQKFELQFDIPSISGKTLGSNNNDALRLETWLTAGTDFSSRSASIGHQSIVFDQAQVQLEAGSVATAFEQRHIAEETTLCLRYFQVSKIIGAYIGYVATGVTEQVWVSFVAPMRDVPSVSATDVANSNFPAGAPTLDRQNTAGFRASKTASATGAGVFQFNWTASAEFV